MDDTEAARGAHAGGSTPASHAAQAVAVWNDRGIIAENYHDLQGLGVLARARAAAPAPAASAATAARAVYQSIEIALLNLSDLTARATADLARGDVGRAVVKVRWAHGVHRVLVRLSLLPQQLGFGDDGVRSTCVVRIVDSPAYEEYVRAVASFDSAALAAIAGGIVDIDQVMSTASLETAAYNLFHSTRVSNHEATIWEHNLLEVRVPTEARTYAELVAPAVIRDAVYDRVLKGDTYFTQFRGLHQIPETLGEEANDHTELAIRKLREQRLPEAIEHLGISIALSEPMLTALAAMSDNLATSDYHDIRENLGLTSGSHSVCLRFHLFTDLYRQLWDEISQQLVGAHAGHDEGALEEAIRATDRHRHGDPTTWMRHHLLWQCLSLRAVIFQWRDEHLHMPRNNLGGSSTKSLTGSPDAIAAVAKMRKAARQSDPMLPLARARGVAGVRGGETEGPLGRYLASESSLDSFVLVATGRVTQSRFQHVQDRLGYFSNRCPFTPPPPRQV